MRRKAWLAAAVVAAVWVGWWSGTKVCGVMPREPQPDSWRASLGLSAAQEAALDDSEAAFRAEVDALCAQLCRDRADLLAEMKDGRVSAEAAHLRVDEIGRRQTELDRRTVAHLIELQQILTAPQARAYIDAVYQQQCRLIHGEKSDGGSR